MATSVAFVLATVTVNTTDWTPIIAPNDCENFVVDNLVGPNNLLFSHDSAGAVQSTIYVGNQWSLLPSSPQSMFRVFRARIKQGQTVGYLKETSGSRAVTVSYVF